MADFIEQLFPYVNVSRIKRFSCGHIIPSENLLTMAVQKGPSGESLEITFEKRTDTKLVSVLFCWMHPKIYLFTASIITIIFYFILHRSMSWAKALLISAMLYQVELYAFLLPILTWIKYIVDGNKKGYSIA